MQINDFLTWQTLAGFSGATAAVSILTQFFKGLFDRLPFHVPTRAVSYIFALIVLVGAAYFTGVRAAGDYFICPINAVLVSFASNGAYDLIRSVSCKGDKDA